MTALTRLRRLVNSTQLFLHETRNPCTSPYSGEPAQPDYATKH
jgi:hypothetical protein